MPFAALRPQIVSSFVQFSPRASSFEQASSTLERLPQSMRVSLMPSSPYDPHSLNPLGLPGFPVLMTVYRYLPPIGYRLSHESAIGDEFGVRFRKSRAAASAVRHRGPA